MSTTLTPPLDPPPSGERRVAHDDSPALGAGTRAQSIIESRPEGEWANALTHGIARGVHGRLGSLDDLDGFSD